MGLSIRKLGSRLYDQVNMFDNNRTFKQRTPTQKKSAVQQGGQVVGQTARGMFSPIAKTVNTGAAAVNVAGGLGNTLRVSLLGSDQDYKKTVNAMTRNNDRFLNPGSGLLGTGSWFKNKDEATNIGTKDLAGRVLGGGAETYLAGKSLKMGGFTGKKLVEEGFKKGIKTQLPNLARNAGVNTLEGIARGRNEGQSWKDAAKTGVASGALGTVGDVGLGVLGAGARGALTPAARKLLKDAPRIKPSVKSKPFVINEGVPTVQPKKPLEIKAGVPLARDPRTPIPKGLKVVDNSAPTSNKLKIVDRSVPRQLSGAAQQSSLARADGAVTARMMKDYIEGKPPVSGSGLSGDGAKAPVSLSPSVKKSLMEQARAKVQLTKLDDRGAIAGPQESPILKAITNAKARQKQPQASSIDPSDPFGNKNLLTKIRNEAGSLVDDDAQMLTLLRKIEKETGKEGLVDQWMFDSGNVRASSSIANAKLKNSEDFSGALKGLSKKDLNEFDEYIAARAELKNYDGLPTSRTPEQNAAIVQAGDAKFGERFGSLNNYYKKQAQDMYDAGIIGKDRLDQYLASDDYVRIQRDMEDLVNPGFGGSRSRSFGSTTANQKRSGSARNILSPTASTAKRTQQIQLEIQRNKAASNLLDVLEEQGLARPIAKGTNKNTMSRFVDGKKQMYEVPGDIKKIVDNVSPYQLGVISRIVSAPARVFRAGTTALSAPFTVTNYLKDQGSSAIYSKSAIDTHNPKNIIAGLGSAARDFAGESRSPLWKKFEEFSGDQTIYDELRNVQNTKRLLREVRLGERGKLGNMVTQPIRTLEDLNSITEKATRFQNFKGIYQKAIKEGLGEDEAIKRAVLAARQNSVDFQRGSSFTRALNLFIPYFNASVQGSRNVARSFKTRPVATTLKSVGFVALPSVAMTAWNLSDENRRKAYDSINEFEKEDNFIIIGPNAKQEENGSWTGIYKVPKPQGYRELTDPVRDVSEAFMKGESVENVAGMFKDMLGGLTGPIDVTDGKKFVGGLIPQAAKPWIQSSMNQDLYTGNDIVPEYMMDETDDATKRAFRGTSGTARLIANQIGVSPIKVERIITDITGSLGRYGINASDNALAATGKIPEEQIGGRSMKTDFSRRLFEASGKLLDENKTPGRRYFENIKTVSEGLNKNELAAFNSLHPSKTNFLGEDIFDENKRITNYTRAGAYINNPGVLEADRKLDQLQRDQGKPGNPLFDLPNPLLTKVLLKAALPPGSKDPELSNLYKQEWYQDYQNARSKYYEGVKSELSKEGKSMPKSTNPYPTTPGNLQKVMDTYSSLPKGTGARSSWIKANPGLWQQMTAQWAQVDAWENKERVAIGLAPVEDEEDASTSKYGSGSGGGGGGGSIGYAGRSKVSAKGTIAKPKISTKSPGKLQGSVKYTASGKPKVTIKKALT